MNIESLKQEFYSYLEGNGKLKGKDVTNADDLNIFDFSNEFRKFLKTQDDIKLSGSGVRIQDLVDTLDESENEDILDVLENAKADMDEDGANVVDFLTFMLEDEDFASTMDADGDNKVDKSELVTFLNSISRNDKNKTNISLRDLIDGGKEVKNGKYEMPEVKSWDEIVEKSGSKKTEAADSASATSASGGGGGVSSSSGGSTTTNAQEFVNAIELAQKELEGKTVEELNALQDTEQQNLAEQETALQAVLSGTSEALSAKKETMDSSYQAFLDLCSGQDELTATAQEQKTALEETELSLNQNVVEKTDTELEKQGVDMQITQVEASITSVSANITALEAELSSLQALQSAQDENSTDKVDYSSQIAALSNEIAQLNQQKTDLETQKEELQNQSNDLQTHIEELETSYNELYETYVAQANALSETETQLVETSQEAADAYATYANNKNEYDGMQTSEYQTAAAAKNAARANLEAIKTQIIVAENEETQAQVVQFATDYDNGIYDPYINKEEENKEE